MSLHSDLLASHRIPSEIETLARELFERACRDDSFDALKRRAAFDRQDAGRLKHWISVARTMAAEGHSRLS